MEHVYNVCVVGAGIIGSSAAYNAAKQTNDVILCEQFPLGHSRGSSHGHSRIIRVSYLQAYYGRMMPEAFEAWKTLESLTKTELLVKSGLLSLQDQPWNNLKAALKPLVDCKSEFEYLKSNELKKDFPMLNFPDSYDAIYEPTGGILKADKCCAAFQNLFKENGGEIRENFRIKEIIPGNVIKIVSDKGIIKAKKVIITAGPWTNDLIKSLALKLPLNPMKIDVCYWQADSSLYSKEKGFPCFIDYSADHHIYGLPVLEYPGLLKVCYHNGNQQHPDARDLEADNQRIEIVGEYLRKYFKNVADKPSIVEKCYYTWTPDEDFIIDLHPVHRNIVIGAGFSGHGFKLAPVTGKLLSQLALDLEPDYDISPFRITRFEGANHLKSVL